MVVEVPLPDPRCVDPPVVHQAAGMAAVQLGIDCADAYDVLDRYAAHVRWPVRALATEIVARSLLLDHANPPRSPVGIRHNSPEIRSVVRGSGPTAPSSFDEDPDTAR